MPVPVPYAHTLAWSQGARALQEQFTCVLPSVPSHNSGTETGKTHQPCPPQLPQTLIPQGTLQGLSWPSCALPLQMQQRTQPPQLPASWARPLGPAGFHDTTPRGPGPGLVEAVLVSVPWNPLSPDTLTILAPSSLLSKPQPQLSTLSPT